MPLPAGSQLPQTSQLLTNPRVVAWADGNYFDGYLWLGIVLPQPGAGASASAVPYALPRLWAANRIQNLPPFIQVPIVNGVIDQSTGLFYNSTIDPPGTTYVAYWFDTNNSLIASANGTAVPFTVSQPQTTLTVPTLPLPSYIGVTNPTPQF